MNPDPIRPPDTDDEPWPFPADLTAGSAIYIGSYAIGAIGAALVALVLVLLVRKAR